MLKEAIDSLVGLAEAASTPKVVDLPKEPADTYGIVVDGKFERVQADPAIRHHNVYSLEAVMDWGQWLDTTGEYRVVVWYNRTGVTALHDGDRRNQAKYKLTASEPMLLMQQMASPSGQRTWKQAEFVKLLRIKLAGCLPSNAFLDLVRKVVFRTGTESTGNVQHGKASLGKRIEAELQGADVVPDMIEFTVPVFENLSIPCEAITCAVDIDAHNEQFTLTPLPGQVEAAWRRAEESVRARLEALIAEGWSGALCYGEP